MVGWRNAPRGSPNLPEVVTPSAQSHHDWVKTSAARPRNSRTRELNGITPGVEHAKQINTSLNASGTSLRKLVDCTARHARVSRRERFTMDFLRPFSDLEAHHARSSPDTGLRISDVNLKKPGSPSAAVAPRDVAK